MRINTRVSTAADTTAARPSEKTELTQPSGSAIEDTFLSHQSVALRIAGVDEGGRYQYEFRENVAERLTSLGLKARAIADSLKRAEAERNDGPSEAHSARLAELRKQQRALSSQIQAEVTRFEGAERGLRAELERLLNGTTRPVFGDSKQRIDEIGTDLLEMATSLRSLAAAQETLNEVPAPMRGLADVNAALSGSIGVAYPKVASVAVDAGLRVGAADIETNRRPTYPFAAVLGTTPIGSAFYMVTAEPGRTGPGFTSNIVPYGSFGWSRVNGRVVGAAVPGVFGVSLRERGEVALNVSFPVSPFVRAGVVGVVGHPILRKAMTPVLNAAEGLSFQIQERVAQFQLWARSQVADENE